MPINHKSVQLAWIATIISTFSALNFSAADFICTADVSYTWNNSPAQSATPQKTPAAQSTPNSTFVGKLEARADTEENAKKEITSRAGGAKAQAAQRCKREHENLSGCVAAKYSAMSTTLNSLTFGARKSLEEAIHTDCELQSGTCGEVILGEASCHEEVKAAEPTPEAGKGADKKGEKKK